MSYKEKGDMFNAPIPGESLTKTKGGSPWERPPQFADKDEAAEHLFTQITNPKKLAKIVSLVETGVPVEVLAKGIILNGFMEGKWTPDVGLMLGRITMGMILSAAKKAGVDDSSITYGNPAKLKEELDFFSRVDEVSGGKMKEKYSKKAPVEEAIMESDETGQPVNLMEKL